MGVCVCMFGLRRPTKEENGILILFFVEGDIDIIEEGRVQE